MPIEKLDKLFNSFAKKYSRAGKMKTVLPDEKLTFNEWAAYIKEQNSIKKNI